MTIKEAFLGRSPSQFLPNPIVKAFIISESFIWSGWNFITPIFAVFVATQIEGGDVRVAATAFSVYMIVRVVFELLSGQYLSTAADIKKLKVTAIGISMLSISYLGFAITTGVLPIYLFYALAGVGIGIASPAKNSLFSSHLDKGKETMEWGIHDAVVFTGMASAAALGGFIASQYGFRLLFIIAMTINMLGILPYLYFLAPKKELNVLSRSLETKA